MPRRQLRWKYKEVRNFSCHSLCSFLCSFVAHRMQSAETCDPSIYMRHQGADRDVSCVPSCGDLPVVAPALKCSHRPNAIKR